MIGSDKFLWAKNSDQIGQQTNSACNSQALYLAQKFAPLLGYFAFSWCNKSFHKNADSKSALGLRISVTTFFTGTCLLVGTASANPTAPNLPNTLPTNGRVIAGSASISQTQAPTSASMTVNQTSQRAVVNWDSFNVGKNATVTFNQPNSSAVTLNRVTGATASMIEGAVKANGQVVFVNPNGVTFVKGSEMNAAGVVATTMDISNKEFMDGKSTYKGNGRGLVVNEGKISTNAEGGYIALLAPEVRNDGYLLAKKGSGAVAMAAGEQITLDFKGNSLMSVKVDVSTYNALIENKRVVEVNGGLVVIAAGSANQLMASVIKNTGRISASSMVNNGGTIELVANTVTQAGKVTANSKTTEGGQINIVGNNIAIAQDSKTSATGATNGGQVNIGLASTQVSGGTQLNIPTQAAIKANADQAVSTKQLAQTVTIEQNALIDTSSTNVGNGGAIAIWSELKTTVAGILKSIGGRLSGNGGFIETSSKGMVILAPSVSINTGANNQSGKAGTWLLDPIDLTIDATTANLISAVLANSNVTIAVTSNTNTCPIGTCTQSGSGNLTIANGADILKAGTNLTTLTLSSAGIFNLNANISGQNLEVIIASSIAYLNVGTTISATKVTVQAQVIYSAGTIQTSSFLANSSNTLGNAIKLLAQAIYVSGRLSVNAAQGSGVAGSIKLEANTITLNPGATLEANGDEGGQITAAANDANFTSAVIQANGGNGRGGTLNLTAANDLHFDQVTLLANGTTDGGALAITTSTGDIYFSNSLVQTNGSTGRGGSIGLSATNSTVIANSNISANGYIQGGKILMGNDASNGALPFSILTDIDRNTVINAAQLDINQNNQQGGFIETSGQTINLLASINAGRGGMWLLDPYNYDIRSTEASRIRSALNSNQNVTITTGNSSALSGTISGTRTSGSDSITISSPITATGSGSLTLTGSTIRVNANIATVGAQTYNGAVVLGSDITLTGSTINFNSAVSGSYGLTISGNAVFGNGSSDTVSLTGSNKALLVSGTSTINANITTSGTQTYTGVVTLGNDITLSANGITTSSPISFGTHDLTLITDSLAIGGVITGSGSSILTIQPKTNNKTIGLAGGVGALNLSTAEMDYLQVPTILIGGSSATGLITMSAYGTLNNAVTSLTLQNSGSSSNGGITIAGELNSLKNFTLTSSGTIRLNANLSSGSSTQTYNGTAVLGSDISLTGSTITFNSPVSGPYGLAITGNAVFGNGSSDTVSLTGSSKALSVSGTTRINANITTSGPQTYDGAVTLGSDVILRGSVISLSAAVGGSYGLTIIGDAVFGSSGSAGVSLTGSNKALSVSGASTINANITTSGSQTYSGSVTLGEYVVLTAETITFNQSINAMYGLSVNGNAIINSNITSSGAQTYSGSLTIRDNVVVVASSFTASSIVTNGNNITINAPDFITINGSINADGANSNSGNGSNGGSVTLSTEGALTLRGISANGGDSTYSNSGSRYYSDHDHNWHYNNNSYNGGDAGAISLSASLIILAGNISSIGGSSSTGSSGIGGAVTFSSSLVITANTVLAANSITAGAITTSGNNITINAGDFVTLNGVLNTGGVNNNSGSGGDGGAVVITAGGALTLAGITANGGESTYTNSGRYYNSYEHSWRYYNNSYSGGDAGSISLTAQVINLSGDINAIGGSSSTGNAGNGGAVTFQSPLVLNGEVNIQTTGRTDGVVSFKSTVDGSSAPEATFYLTTDGSGISYTWIGIKLNDTYLLNDPQFCDFCQMLKPGGNFNDNVLSIRLSPHTILTLYQDGILGGWSQTLNNSDSGMSTLFVLPDRNGSSFTLEGSDIGKGSLTINSGQKTIVFSGAVGANTLLSNLTTLSPTSVGANIFTLGNQSYGGSVTLTNNVRFDADNFVATAITTGGRNIAINTTGDTTISGLLSTAGSLNSNGNGGDGGAVEIIADGTLTLNGVTTNGGNSTYNNYSRYYDDREHRYRYRSGNSYDGGNAGNIQLYGGVMNVSGNIYAIGGSSNTGSDGLGGSLSLGIGDDSQITGAINASALSLIVRKFADPGANLSLNGSRIYPGSITINGGVLSIVGSGSLSGGNYSDVLTVSIGATFNFLSSTNQIFQTGSLAGTGVINLGGSLISRAIYVNGDQPFTGVINVNAGVLTVSGGLSDGTALTVADGATYNLAANNRIASIAGAGTIALNGWTLTVGDSNTTEVTGPITGDGGSLTKVGAGTLILSGNNTYTGATVISAGTLAITNNNGLGADDGGVVTISNGATLDLRNVAVGAKAIVLNGGTLKDVTSSLAGDITLGADSFISVTNTKDVLTLSGAISGAYALNKVGAGTLVLSGNNAYSGGTNINEGILKLGPANALGDVAGTVSILGGATLDLNGQSIVNTNLMVISGSGTTGSGALINSSTQDASYAGDISLGFSSVIGAMNPITLSGTISGSNALTKSGTGILLLSGSNVYSGGTNINEGILQLATTTGLGDASGVISIYTGATLDLNGQAITNTNPMVISGAGVDGLGALVNSSIQAASYAGKIMLNGDASFGGSGNMTITGVITDTPFGPILTTLIRLIGHALNINTIFNSALIKEGDGILTLTGTNAYNGGTVINGGILAINADRGLGSAPLLRAIPTSISLNGGTLQANNSFTLNSKRGIVLGEQGGGLAVTDGHTLTYGGIIAGACDGCTLTINGSGQTGTVKLSGINTYTGVTTISSGTLALSGAGSIANSSSVYVDSIFDISGVTIAASIKSLEDSGYETSIVNLGLKRLMITDAFGNFSGSITGSGSLVIAGGIQTLSGVNTYTGTTTINAGATLALAGSGNIAESSSVVVNGTLDISQLNSYRLLDLFAELLHWEQFGSIGVSNSLVQITFENGDVFSLTPAVGKSMISINPSGSNIGDDIIDSILGLPAGTMLANTGSRVTNFGLITKNMSLIKGTYSFSWAYAAQDYLPFLDGVFFSLAGGVTSSVAILARNGEVNSAGIPGYQPSTLIMPSFGSTNWITYTFQVPTSGTYKVGFGDFNFIDTQYDPVLFVSPSAGGSFGAPIAGISNVAANIKSLSGSGVVNLGAQTLKINIANSQFGGSISDGGIAGGLGGSLIVAGGTQILSGNNTYTGTTTIDQATLTLGSTTAISGSAGLVSISNGGTLNLNGFSLGNALAISGEGVGSNGAIVNSSSTPSTLSGNLILNGDSTLGGSGSITITGIVNSDHNLLSLKTGSFNLNNLDNLISSLAASSVSSLNLVSSSPLVLNSAGVSSNGDLAITAQSIEVAGAVVARNSGAIALIAANDFVMNLGSSISSDAGDIVISSGNFINNAGSDALVTANNARWIIYSTSPDTNIFGTDSYLVSGNEAIWGNTYLTLAPGSVGSGNRYVFSTNNSVTISLNSSSTKVYGTELDTSNLYTVTGNYDPANYHNVFLNSGSASLTGISIDSRGIGSSANVGGGEEVDGNYMVTLNPTATAQGYTISYGNTRGLLAVTPAPLAIYVNAVYNSTTTYTSDNAVITLAGLATLDAGGSVTSVEVNNRNVADANYVTAINSVSGFNLNNYQINVATNSILSGSNPVAGDTHLLSANLVSLSKANLSIASTLPFNRVYDGAPVSTGYSIDAKGSDANLIVVTGAITETNAGQYTPNLVASGDVLANYNTPAIENGTLIIQAKPVTITNNLIATAYNGTSIYADLIAAASYSHTALVGSDAIGSVAQTASIGGSTVTGVAQAGAFTSTPSAAVLSTGNLDNYSFSYVGASNTVAKADLTIAAVASLTGNTYRGTAYTGTYTTTALGSDASSIAVIGQASGINAGTYTSSLSASGSVLNNYNTPTITNANLVITPAPLGIELVGSYSGTRTIAPTAFTVTGLLLGDTINSIVSANLMDANVLANGSNYVSSITGVAGTAVMGNYYITTSYNSTPNTTTTNSARITPANLVITATNDAKFVTQTDSFAYANNCGANTTCAGGYMGVTYNGFVNGEAPDVLPGTLAVARLNSGENSAGVYAGVLRASGLTSNNYNIRYADGDYVIAPAHALLVRVKPASQDYGTNPSYVAKAQYLESNNTTIVDLVPTISGSNITVVDGVGGSANFDLALVGAMTSTSGNIKVGGYNLTSANAVVAGVNFRSLMVVGSNTVLPYVLRPNQLGISGVSKVYDGNINIGGLALNVNPTLSPVLGSGVNKDQVTIIGSGTFDTPNVGINKAIDVNLTLAGDDGANYVLESSSYRADIGTITQLNSVSYVGAAGGKWSTQSNWAGGAIPTLNNVANVYIPVGSSVLYDLAKVNLVGAMGSNIINNGILTINESVDTAISNTLSGSGVYVQAGSGVLTISGNNSQSTPGAFTGQISIANGRTLVLANANALGNGSILSSGGRLAVQDGIALANLIVSGPISLISDVVTRGAQTYSGAVTISSGSAGNPMVMTSQNSGITFGGILNSDAANRSLTLNALLDKVTFTETVGYLSPSRISKGPAIYDLVINAQDILLMSDIYTLSTQTYNGAVVVSDNGSNGLVRKFLSQDPSISFLGTVDDSSAVTHTLDVRAVSFDVNQVPAIAFMGPVGSIVPLGGLIVTTETRITPSDPSLPVIVSPSGSLTIGGNINTVGGQSFSTGGVSLQPPFGTTITLRSERGTIQFAGISDAARANLNTQVNVVSNGVPSTSSTAPVMAFSGFIPSLEPEDDLLYTASVYRVAKVKVSEPEKPVPCKSDIVDECGKDSFF